MTHVGTTARHAGRLIEFFGPPGAGKTTLANAIADQSDVLTRHPLSDRWSRHTAIDRGRRIARGFLSGRSLAAAARLIASRRLMRRESMLRLGRLIAKHDWLASQTDIVLLDQGMLQELYSALYAARIDDVEPAALRPLLAALYRPLRATIYVLNVDPSVAEARIGQRTYGRSKLDRMAADRRASALARTLRLQQRIIAAARLTGLTVHELDGATDIAQLAAQVIDSSQLPARDKGAEGRSD